MLKEAYVGELTGKVDFSLWFKRFSEGEKKQVEEEYRSETPKSVRREETPRKGEG